MYRMVDVPKETMRMAALVLLATPATDATSHFIPMEITKTTSFPTIPMKETTEMTFIDANWIARMVVFVRRGRRIFHTWMVQSIT